MIEVCAPARDEVVIGGIEFDKEEHDDGGFDAGAVEREVSSKVPHDEGPLEEGMPSTFNGDFGGTMVKLERAERAAL